jgi:hypothetical protein
MRRLALVPTSVLLVTSLLLTPGSANAEPRATVVTQDGQKYTGYIDGRTTSDALCLRFGGGSTIIRRRIAWNEIAATELGGLPMGREQLMNYATRSTSAQRAELPLPGPAYAPPITADTLPLSPGDCPRVTHVQFDAGMANWDADVETDGLLLYVRPLSCDEQLIRVSGVVHVEVIAGRHVRFHDVPYGRGETPRVLAQWVVSLDSAHYFNDGAQLRLPLTDGHPELDPSWSPRGLVHVRLVAPGHGVFEDSMDAIRIRPFAPLRDTLQQNTGRRFFAGEMIGQ